MRIENNMTMKMKLDPELSCLETQEKFWRGKFKEISEKFAEERKEMETLIIQITSENERLKNELFSCNIKPSRCSVAVQTSPVTKETDTLCKYCQKPVVKTRTIFSKEKYNTSENRKKKEYRSELYIDDDLILRRRDNDLSTKECLKIHDNEDHKNDVKKTITKLFSSSDHLDSENITGTLIELYEKRCQSIPNITYNENMKEIVLKAENNPIVPDGNDNSQAETLENEEMALNETDNKPILNESTSGKKGVLKFSKSNKIKLLPTMQNFRKKVFRNFSKIKRTCTDIKMNDDKLNSRLNASIEVPVNSEIPAKTALDSKSSNEGSSVPSPKRQLISAMKKSKSTGNIVKKVAFLDDLPSMKTVSESNLLEVNDYRFERRSDVDSLLVGSVQVHCDKFAKPIPAPRSRKNIVVINP